MLLSLLFTSLLYFTSIFTTARILRNSCSPGYANFSYVIEDAVLQGSIIATFKNQSAEQCEVRCFAEFWCKSINIELSGEKTCELNRESEADKTDEQTLTPKRGWQFKSTDYTDPLIGDVCKKLKPCPSGHLCIDSCDCPGYVCYVCPTIKLGMHCDKPITGVALNIEQQSAIRDFQMSSSSETRIDEGAFKARLNFMGDWCAKFGLNDNQFVRVDFWTRKVITDVAVQGHYSLANVWVESFRLLYTEDSYKWKTYQENGIDKVFVRQGHDYQKHRLSTFIRAFAVKLNPIRYHTVMCLRMELYGINDPVQPAKPTDCVSTVKPLGMASGEIPDSSITASSSFSKKNLPKFARLNHYAEWCSEINEPLEDSYLQVDLGKQMVVTDVAIQGRCCQWSGWVKSFYLGYGYTGIAAELQWVMNQGSKKVFQGNTDSRNIIKNQINPPITARFIRINPKENNGNAVCMRMELYGCKPL